METRAIDIEEGSTRLERLAAGSTIVLEHGVLRIEAAPQWLAETVVRPRTVLRSGAAWQVDSAGWVAFTATELARYRVHRPSHPGADASRWAMNRLADSLGRIARALRRRARHSTRTSAPS